MKFQWPNFSVPLIARKAFAEFIGTYILIVIGNGSIAQSHLSNGDKGNFFSINWGWALGLTLGVLASANISGGHLNPAFTLALTIARRFSWKDLLFYVLAQYLGALAASGTVLGIYYEAIQAKLSGSTYKIIQNPDDPGMAQIFANYPAAYLSTGLGLAEEILATFLFIFVICVVTERRNGIPFYMQPLYIGFSLLAMGIAYGANSGYGLNPARDLAPRLVSYLAGWGPGVFSFRGYNSFWIYIVGPHIGAILAVGLFEILLKIQPVSQSYSNLEVSKIEYCSRQTDKYQTRKFQLFNENEVSEENASPSRKV